VRRTDREVKGMEDIISIIERCDVCRLAFFDEEYPYIIPLNFGYSYENEELIFYFHGAKVGKKLDLIAANNKVGFEMDCSHELVEGDEACEYSMTYESVCGNGQVELLDKDAKINALNKLMKQYTSKENFQFNEKVLAVTEVFQLKVSNITGKRKVIKK
jgi:nitroimidazol reductase NimA-like FMN-containing flavoprotein (pyridoxamine 5'-phosphate oxidase superfamily)